MTEEKKLGENSDFQTKNKNPEINLTNMINNKNRINNPIEDPLSESNTPLTTPLNPSIKLVNLTTVENNKNNNTTLTNKTPPTFTPLLDSETNSNIDIAPISTTSFTNLNYKNYMKSPIEIQNLKKTNNNNNTIRKRSESFPDLKTLLRPTDELPKDKLTKNEDIFKKNL